MFGWMYPSSNKQFVLCDQTREEIINATLSRGVPEAPERNSSLR